MITGQGILSFFPPQEEGQTTDCDSDLNQSAGVARLPGSFPLGKRRNDFPPCCQVTSKSSAAGAASASKRPATRQTSRMPLVRPQRRRFCGVFWVILIRRVSAAERDLLTSEPSSPSAPPHFRENKAAPGRPSSPSNAEESNIADEHQQVTTFASLFQKVTMVTRGSTAKDDFRLGIRRADKKPA